MPKKLSGNKKFVLTVPPGTYEVYDFLSAARGTPRTDLMRVALHAWAAEQLQEELKFLQAQQGMVGE